MLAVAVGKGLLPFSLLVKSFESTQVGEAFRVVLGFLRLWEFAGFIAGEGLRSMAELHHHTNSSQHDQLTI